MTSSTPPLASQTLIRAVEVWMPNDGQLLEITSAWYGSARAFSARSRSLCFGRGEGLPGRVWEEGCPILLSAFDHHNFRRTDAAHAAGLRCAVALPFFREGQLLAVLMMFCGDMAQHASAMELWQSGAAATDDIRLVEGAYGTASAAFGAISRQTTFARGAGLPGTALAHQAATFLEQLGQAGSSFVRGEAAGAGGLIRGLAIPVPSAGGTRHILTLLASAALPLAQRIERWVRHDAPLRLRRAYAFSELHGGSSQVEAFLDLAPAGGSGQCAMQAAWFGGHPAINEHPPAEPGAPAAAAAGIGAGALLVIPVDGEGGARELLVLYL